MQCLGSKENARDPRRCEAVHQARQRESRLKGAGRAVVCLHALRQVPIHAPRNAPHKTEPSKHTLSWPSSSPRRRRGTHTTQEHTPGPEQRTKVRRRRCPPPARARSRHARTQPRSGTSPDAPQACAGKRERPASRPLLHQLNVLPRVEAVPQRPIHLPYLSVPLQDAPSLKPSALQQPT